MNVYHMFVVPYFNTTDQPTDPCFLMNTALCIPNTAAYMAVTPVLLSIYPLDNTKLSPSFFLMNSLDQHILLSILYTKNYNGYVVCNTNFSWVFTLAS